MSPTVRVIQMNTLLRMYHHQRAKIRTMPVLEQNPLNEKLACAYKSKKQNELDIYTLYYDIVDRDMT